MAEYRYGNIRRLAHALAKEGIGEDVAMQVLAGGETITEKSSPEAKTEWMAGAMRRMDALFDAPTRRAVRVRCACCLGGKRLQISRGIAREHAALDDRVRAANEAKFVFGHSVIRVEDGGFLVCFAPEGQAQYGCPCLRGAKEPLSITYCYCCGGHVRHHLQTALGRKLDVKVLSSALSSGGRKPCTFLLHALE